MAARRKTASKRKTGRFRPVKFLLRTVFQGVVVLVAVLMTWVAFYAAFDPPTTPYMTAEGWRLGELDYDWVDADDIAPVMLRSAVAAEDANFCLHWGLDISAIRAALEDGGNRGGSTISQQVTKNAFLWHGRSWLRKAIEAALTPGVEALWTKRRILEVYLNIAEFDEGVFGVQAAAQHYFGVDARDLTDRQAALLAAMLPNPKGRSASDPSAATQRRANSIRDGAATIAADGRAACFES